jgi:hypothetical protein
MYGDDLNWTMAEAGFLNLMADDGGAEAVGATPLVSPLRSELHSFVDVYP